LTCSDPELSQSSLWEAIHELGEILYGAPWRSGAVNDRGRVFLIMTDPRLPFDFWKLCLREDCVLEGKLLDFESLGDECLWLLWQSGALPCVFDIMQERETVN